MSPMQKPNSEGSETDQKSFLSAYQESLMSTCSEIIDSLTSEKDSDGLSKNIKIERSGSTEQDDWISGFDTSISTEPTKDTSVTIKQELQLGKEILVMLDSNEPIACFEGNNQLLVSTEVYFVIHLLPFFQGHNIRN